jgi:hypothetical protein
MAGITLAQASAQLAVWIAASTAVASGQSYSMGERSLTLANAAEIRKSIEFWDAKVSELTAAAGGGGRKIRGITPC